ncbi:hypothetical protein ACIOJE_08045 [Kitasatospora sp. NPDC087861]|uniref:hypothetical protein n=1 Tax=Kitasatospora sp. NPDC087861 TaxID=3364070 RepID=UPI0037F11D8F
MSIISGIWSGGSPGRLRRDARRDCEQICRVYSQMLNGIEGNFTPEEFREVRAAVRSAASRRFRHRVWVRRFCESTPGFIAETALFAALIAGTYWVYGHFIHPGSSWSALEALNTGIWAVALYGAIIVFRIAFNPIASLDGRAVADKSARYQLLLALAWISMVPIMTWGFIAIAIQWSGGRLPPLLAVDFRASVLLLGLTMFARPVVRTLAGRWLVKTEMSAHPFDGMILSFLQCAHSIESSKEQWHVGSRSRYLIAWIEVAAKECERFPSASRRVAFVDRAARRSYRDIGYQVAAVVRSHKIMVARAGRERDYSAAAESFCSALVGLGRGEIGQLLVNAGEVSNVSRMRVAARRVGPSLPLFVAAFVIPLIPQVSASSEAVGGIRVTLIIAGTLSLIVPLDSPAGSRVMDAVAKSLEGNGK